MARRIVGLLAALLAIALAGCGSARLMPAPNLFLVEGRGRFDEVPESLRNSSMDVVFATDRQPNYVGKKRVLEFGHKRSANLSVGTCRIDVGKKLPWEDLVQGSLKQGRSHKYKLYFNTPEIAFRYPGTWWHAATTEDQSATDEEFQTRRLEARANLQRVLKPRLDATPRKEVFLFVHGYNNTFNNSIETIGNIWHFLGREGVPIAYTWPAGAGGLTGYSTDRESCEFTIYHLKMFIEDLAADPDIEKIHILAHSRGTDVTMTALREIGLSLKGGGKDPHNELKLGNIVLASPDIDLEVAGQRFSAEGVPDFSDHFTIYLSGGDTALKVSAWFQGSLNRLGLLNSAFFTPERAQVLSYFRNLELIECNVDTDFIGHSYFYNNPAVSSDLVLLLRDNFAPGAESHRPMTLVAPRLWRIDDEYPLKSPGFIESLEEAFGKRKKREVREAAPLPYNPR